MKIEKTRRVVLLLLFWSMAVGGTAVALQTDPLPGPLVAAKKLFLVDDSGDRKAYDKFCQELKKWGRFTIVTAQGESDAIAVLTTRADYSATVHSGNVFTGAGTFATFPVNYLYLKVFDAKTGLPLWSDGAEKWTSAGHAPSALVSNLKKRMPKQQENPKAK